MAEGRNNSGIMNIALFIGAVLLVILLDLLVFPSIAGITGLFRGMWDVKTIGIGLLVILGLVIALTFIVFRGENRAKFLGEARTRIWDPILRNLLRTEAGAKVLGDIADIRARTLPGELPFELKELRLEIYTLMNMMLRHEIHRAKASIAHGLVDKFAQREKIMVDRIPTPVEINRNMRKYIEGAKIIKVGNKWILDPKDKDSGLGFARSYFIIFEIMEELRRLLGEDLSVQSVSQNDVDDAVSKYLGERYSTVVGRWWQNILENYTEGKRYKAAVNRFRTVNFIKMYMIYFMDMYNMYGKYRRGYWFTNPAKKPKADLWEWEQASTDGVTQSIRLTKKVTDPAILAANDSFRSQVYEPGNEKKELLELDIYNRCTYDMNIIELHNKTREEYPYVRKFKRKDVVYLHREKVFGDPPFYWKIADFADKDWSFFVDDLEKGSYHPYSRTLSDYNELISRQNIDFGAATFKREVPLKGEIAFDREALKNPGAQIYWGRKDYFKENPENVREDPKSPYPTTSLHGLWGFISDVALYRIDDPELAKKYLDYIKMRYGELEKQSEGGNPPGH